MQLCKIQRIANSVLKELKPYCERIEIAGSIRRQKPDPNDIEIVAIPKPYDVGLFESGIATVINKWQKVKGELPCKYTQRLLPEGVKLDLFFATGILKSSNVDSSEGGNDVSVQKSKQGTEE